MGRKKEGGGKAASLSRGKRGETLQQADRGREKGRARIRFLRGKACRKRDADEGGGGRKGCYGARLSRRRAEKGEKKLSELAIGRREACGREGENAFKQAATGRYDGLWKNTRRRRGESEKRNVADGGNSLHSQKRNHAGRKNLMEKRHQA